MSLATKAYRCLEERIKIAPHCRPQRADIVEMLGGEDGEQYIKDCQHDYLCTDNIVRAARVSQLNLVVIGEGRIWVAETARSDSNLNIAAFRHWLVEEMREMPPGIAKNSLLARLKVAWENTLNRPVLKQHRGGCVEKTWMCGIISKANK
jgi:hypothetical protein